MNCDGRGEPGRCVATWGSAVKLDGQPVVCDVQNKDRVVRKRVLHR